MTAMVRLLLTFGLVAVAASATDCPLAPRAVAAWEVLAFVLESNWTSLDWAAVTTVAWFGGADPAASDVCLAHARGARVVLQSDLSAIPGGDLSNVSARAAGVQTQLARAQRLGVDGLNLDIEGFAGNASLLTTYVRELCAAFRAAIPTAHMSFDLSVSPDGQKEYYDHKSLAQVLDFLVPMAYDEDWGSLTPRANSPLPALPASVEQYKALGVDPQSLLYALPWYGGVWPCDDKRQGQPCATSLHGKDWDQVVGREAYNSVFSHVGVDNTSAVTLEAATTTKTFEFVTGGTRFVTYMDDGETLSKKVDAVRAAGNVRGAAMWYAEDIDGLSSQQRAAMWNAFKPLKAGL